MNEAGGYDAFVMYQALKFHFEGNYDYVKYNGKVRATKEQFMARKDKFSFYKLSRKYKSSELFNFYLANFLHREIKWVGDLMEEDSNEVYKIWSSVQQSLTYKFQQDISYLMDLVEVPEDMLKVVDGQYPLLYNNYLTGKINLETIVILNDLINFMPMWQKKISDDIVFPNFAKKCEKYRPFLQYDKVKFKNILKEKICQPA